LIPNELVSKLSYTDGDEGELSDHTAHESFHVVGAKLSV
jgi:hypothetical protein